MNKQNAINCIKFLNEVSIKGHDTREAMNAVCAELLEIINAEPPEDPDGETDTE